MRTFSSPIVIVEEGAVDGFEGAATGLVGGCSIRDRSKVSARRVTSVRQSDGAVECSVLPGGMQMQMQIAEYLRGVGRVLTKRKVSSRGTDDFRDLAAKPIWSGE